MSAGLVPDAGALWVGPTDAAAPSKANHTTAMDTIDPDWVNVGRLSKTGISLGSTPTIVELFSFGDNDPTRTKKTREVKTFAALLQSWSTASLTLALNGGTVTVTTGVAEYLPEDDTTLVDHSLCWEFEDGAVLNRLYLPLVEVRSGISLGFSDEDYTVLPLEVTVLKPVSDKAFKIYSNDADFVAT